MVGLCGIGLIIAPRSDVLHVCIKWQLPRISCPHCWAIKLTQEPRLKLLHFSANTRRPFFLIVVFLCCVRSTSDESVLKRRYINLQLQFHCSLWLYGYRLSSSITRCVCVFSPPVFLFLFLSVEFWTCLKSSNYVGWYSSINPGKH